MLTGTSTFTGIASITSGTVSVSSIGNAGTPGNLGAAAQTGSSAFPIQLTTNSLKVLRYTGPGETCNRNIYINQQDGTSTYFDASGTGPLVLSGSISASMANSSWGNSDLVLCGTNTGDNTLSGNATDNTRLGIQKLDTGTWSLVGNRNYSAGTDVANGTLKFDSIANAGTQCALGKAAMPYINNLAVDYWISLSTGSTSAVLQYTGTGASASNRNIGINGHGTLSTGSAAGTLNLSGSVYLVNGGARTLTLDGANTGANAISGPISDSGTTRFSFFR